VSIRSLLLLLPGTRDPLEKIMRFSAAVRCSGQQHLRVLRACSVRQRYVKEVALKHL